MALTDELKRIYSSAPVNTTVYEALLLTNPAWTSYIALINNSVEPRDFNFKGVLTSYQPATFRVLLPKRNDFGLVDFEVQIPLTAQVASMLILAEQSKSPIQAAMTVYIDGQLDEQMTPIELTMDRVTMNDEFANGKAQRIDLLNRIFPRTIVRPDVYPGLWR
jgi:hypothetical protein